ncbi:MAG: C1 family peptidase [Halioglobus sp.]
MAAKKTNVQADYPDSRDWIYRPALVQLESEVPSCKNVDILNQHSEGACTGFALAAAINLLNRRGGNPLKVSERMLYEMAKRHDEWAGEDYNGSSLRGAIHGFKGMGVCSQDTWPFVATRAGRGNLTIERAKAAREITLGAYYRMRPVVSDYHAALMETGVVVASARYHPGWDNPVNGRIEKKESQEGGHAFAITGYTQEGFWIQNSWGKNWGDGGCALWSYEDWIENVMDAWAFRLALPTPQIFGMRPMSSRLINSRHDDKEAAGKARAPMRDTIAGHFVHIDDGKFSETDRYWSTAFDVKQTADFVAQSNDYKHLLIYGHGGLNSPKDSAIRIAAMKPVFKANGIYPYHIMYDTGLVEELKDLIMGKSAKANELVGGAADWLDRMVEHIVRRPGSLLWNEMKSDAHAAFAKTGAGTESLKYFISALGQTKKGGSKSIHLAGHSTGAVLFAHMVDALRNQTLTIDSCTLMAPACSVDLYHKTYLRILDKKHKLRIKHMDILNLKDKLEQDDTVGSRIAYRKSLLYLVSNAFEQEKELPLLGMEKFVKEVKDSAIPPNFHYSNGVTGNKTRSTTHGGFDNDVHTMNHILRTILGKAPTRPFEEKDLDY